MATQEVRLNSSERVDLPPRELSTRTLGSALKEVWSDMITPIHWGLPASNLLKLRDCALSESDPPEEQSALCVYAAKFQQGPHYMSDLSGERYITTTNP